MTKPHPARGGGDRLISEGRAAVVGTLDAALRIDRVSGEALTLFACPPEKLLGESFLSLVAEEDVPAFLFAYAQAATSQQGVTLELNLCHGPADRGSPTVVCEVFVVPLRPSPGCAFVLRPVIIPAEDPRDIEPAAVVVPRSGRGGGAERSDHVLLRGVSDHAVSGVGRLTTRERQIVARLLDGHRPPGIARALFLSQSTVRNHLASVFRKLGVTSQEGLLELFRVAAARDGDEAEAFLEHGQVTRIS